MFIKPKTSNAEKSKKDTGSKSIRRKSPPRASPIIKRKQGKILPPLEVIERKYQSESESEDECDVVNGKIDSIQFSFMGEKEVEDFAVVEITETKLIGGPNTLYDPKMGPPSKSDICETCDQNWDNCPGHFGFIRLNAKVPHPLRSKNILEYLSVFCKDCQRLVITKESIELLGFNKYKSDARYKKILSHVENNVCVCPFCESIIPTYNFFDDKYTMEIKDKKYPLQYDAIYKIFSNIRDCDIELLGFNPRFVHPIKLMLVNLLVIPPCVRPYIRLDDGEPSHDDLTFKYIDIIKKNNKIAETHNEKAKLDAIDELMFHIRTLMDNAKGKAREISGKRPIKCIKQRISSKQGRIRQNIQGKRVNFCARTVIGGDANCMVDELVIPPDVAKKLTYPIKVTEHNMNMCNNLLNEGKVNTIFQDGVQKNAKYAVWIEGFKFKKGDILIRNGKEYDVYNMALIKHEGDIDKIVSKEGDKVIRDGKMIKNLPVRTRKDFQLKIGDTIERQLQNGDLVVFNRQPTLWKGSMRAKRVKILPGKTFRFNLASTQAFNADYDGDEMNLWLAETENSRAECATILNTVDNFMSSQDSKPLLALKQDAMTGGYVLTDGIVKIPKHTFFECITADYFDMEYIFNKFEMIKKVYEKNGKVQEVRDKLYIDKGINEHMNKINELKDEHSKLKGDNKQTRRKLEIKEEHSRLKELVEKLKQEVEEEIDNEVLYTGHSLFSMILPDDFEYFANNGASKDGKPVVVTRGVLISGTLDKMAIGSSSGSLIHHIAKDYGYKKACDFVSYYQILINNWLIHHGYTISLEDCIPTNTNIIESEMNKCLLKAVAEMRSEKDEEQLENKITGILNEATTVGQKIAKDALDNNSKNNMVRIILSGAKGNFFNITQVTGAVGQQNVNGNRIVPTCNGRTLPHYKNYPKNIIEICENEGRDPLPILKEMFESRGFVKNSYFKGLSPQEYFFHAAGGREGVLDTALKTANTGYIQRKMIKMVEDLKFGYTGVVSNSKESIIEFMYGEDNMDASRLIKTSEGLSFIDIKHINDKLNADIEWEV